MTEFGGFGAVGGSSQLNAAADISETSNNEATIIDTLEHGISAARSLQQFLA